MTSRDGPTKSAAGTSGRGGAGLAAAGAGAGFFAGTASSATGGLFFESTLAGDMLGGVGRVADWGTAPATSQLSVAVAADDRGSAMAARLMHCDELDNQIPEHTHTHTDTHALAVSLPPPRRARSPAPLAIREAACVPAHHTHKNLPSRCLPWSDMYG
jgi:hypothetical protein